ncbi:MAG: hypothetical protein ABIL62_02535 [Planctomycetota bacterium]
MTLTCHPFGKLRASSEAKPKDLANDKEILPLRLRSGLKAFFAQNDSFAITLAHFRHCKLTSYIKSSKLE